MLGSCFDGSQWFPYRMFPLLAWRISWFLYEYFIISQELPSANGNMESCPCPSSWMYCNTKTIWNSICVSLHSNLSSFAVLTNCLPFHPSLFSVWILKMNFVKKDNSMAALVWSWLKCVGRWAFHLVFSTFWLGGDQKPVLLWLLILMLTRLKLCALSCFSV